MPIGPYGSDYYGDGVDSFPAAPRAFTARPGLQGPQVVVSWEAPINPFDKIMVRRKQSEYPRDIDDGDLVLLEEDDTADLLQCVDLAEALLPVDAEAGEGVWWYYRAFVQPAPLPLADQFAGLGKQTLIPSIFAGFALSVPIDVQDARSITIYLENTAVAADSAVQVETAPEYDGPWVVVDVFDVLAGTAETWTTSESMKFLRIRDTGTSAAVLVVQFSVDLAIGWLTSDALTVPCYAFKTGRHLAAALVHLPEFYLTDDEAQGLQRLTEGPGEDGEYFNLERTGEALGPLTRFLGVYLAEFDRVDAYLRAVRAYTADIDQMPPHLFAHVATMLGYPLETDGRNLNEIRAEIFRISGVWKLKGTSKLIQATCEQIFGMVPRVQEGAGRVFRVADPDLYGRVIGQMELISE